MVGRSHGEVQMERGGKQMETPPSSIAGSCFRRKEWKYPGSIPYFSSENDCFP